MITKKGFFMGSIDTFESEAKRLEHLWGGQFGDSYVERNKTVGEHRGPFWKELLDDLQLKNVLEVGCNLGGNLRWIASILPPKNVYGVDINLKSLEELHNYYPAINAIWSPARDLPYRDRWFDLVFTMGVLIHQPEDALPIVMSEIVRCSKRYVLCSEYFAQETQEVSYHGQRGALFKRNYASIYLNLFPELRLIKEGFLGKKDGWDDVTYWVFEKS
jgi:pseudaminic acid biosynthesis-associated methylase